jgi:hypothetical protein
MRGSGVEFGSSSLDHRTPQRRVASSSAPPKPMTIMTM